MGYTGSLPMREPWQEAAREYVCRPTTTHRPYSCPSCSVSLRPSRLCSTPASRTSTFTSITTSNSTPPSSCACAHSQNEHQTKTTPVYRIVRVQSTELASLPQPSPSPPPPPPPSAACSYQRERSSDSSLLVGRTGSEFSSLSPGSNPRPLSESDLCTSEAVQRRQPRRRCRTRGVQVVRLTDEWLLDSDLPLSQSYSSSRSVSIADSSCFSSARSSRVEVLSVAETGAAAGAPMERTVNGQNKNGWHYEVRSPIYLETAEPVHFKQPDLQIVNDPCVLRSITNGNTETPRARVSAKVSFESHPPPSASSVDVSAKVSLSNGTGNTRPHVESNRSASLRSSVTSCGALCGPNCEFECIPEGQHLLLDENDNILRGLALAAQLPESPERVQFRSRRRVHPESVSSVDSVDTVNSAAFADPAELQAGCMCAGLTGAKLDRLVRFLYEHSNDPLDCRAYLHAYLSASPELAFVAFQNTFILGKADNCIQ